MGNVLTVISDKPLPHDNGSGSADYFLADIRQSTDYSPFGVQLTGRNFTASGVSKQFRYGYQNSEQDDEIKGDGNSYTTEFRQLDPRLGRWLSLDPMMGKLPHQSPYCSMDNNPILNNDPLGKDVGYETKLDKFRVGFAKLISKRFRAAHAQREAAAEMYIYRRRHDEPPLVAPRIRFDGTIPIIVDAGKEARYSTQDQFSVLYGTLGLGKDHPGPNPGPNPGPDGGFHIPLPHIKATWEKTQKEVSETGRIELPRQADGSNPVQGPYVFKSPDDWVPGTEIRINAHSHADNFTVADGKGNIIPFTDEVSGACINSSFDLVMGLGQGGPGIMQQDWVVVPGEDLRFAEVDSWNISVTSQRTYTIDAQGKQSRPQPYSVFEIRYTKYGWFPHLKKLSLTWE